MRRDKKQGEANELYLKWFNPTSVSAKRIFCNCSVMHPFTLQTSMSLSVVTRWSSSLGQVKCSVKFLRRTTCPCPRRRRESEVLVGCFAASVSEVSLAFCCVGKSEQSHKLYHMNSWRSNFQSLLAFIFLALQESYEETKPNTASVPTDSTQTHESLWLTDRVLRPLDNRCLRRSKSGSEHTDNIC